MAVDRASGEAKERHALAVSEWAVVGAAVLFLISLTTFDWFAFSVEGRAAPGTGGDAFRWLDGIDYFLLLTGLAALTAPLARLAGLTRATPHGTAMVTGLAGLVGAVVVTYLIAAPPDVSSDIQGTVGGGPSTETIARGGAVIGLAGTIAIAALSALTLLASPAALAPIRRRQPAAAPEPALAAAAPPPPKPAPKPAARKQATKPEARTPAAKPAPSKPKPARRPRLATATAAQLTRVGFTKAQAERIVAYRKDGRVTKLTDLKRVPGIAKPVLTELVKRLDD